MRFHDLQCVRNARSAANPLLTVIITLRARSHYDMVQRLRFRALDTERPSNCSFLVVDEGSPDAEAERIATICEELGFDLVRMDSAKPWFCASSARNVGAVFAKSELIMHEDIDMMPYPGFYSAILDEIEVQGLRTFTNRFITVPALYLSDETTTALLGGTTSKSAILHSFLMADGTVPTTLPGSSVIVVNRYYYLSIGGYNESFNGWGLEDLEYAYRLVRSWSPFPNPKDHRWLVEGAFLRHSAYRGWRSQFRLHGDLLARKGRVLFHAHHPTDAEWRNKDAHSNNRSLFQSSLLRFDREGHYLTPLPAIEGGRSLIFGTGCFAYNRALLPALGDVEIRGYQHFENADIVGYVNSNNIDRLVFTNPYANEQRTAVYKRARDAGVPFFVVERGALTDSMFIDPTGFCCESTLYSREHWPDLTPARRTRVERYIATETSSPAALEKQGARIGPRALRAKLGLPAYKRVVFVPFQSRSDTTVTRFAGPIGTYDNFVQLLRAVAAQLPPDWALITKRHPLSDVPESVPGAIDAGDAHIKDLIELADHVLLMNSGVGVLAAMFGKPVIYTARAFYADGSLNRPATTADDVVRLLTEPFEVDQEARLRFISYLTEDFYSFGRMKTEEKKYTEDARLTITTEIDYYQVRIKGERIVDYDVDPQKLHPHAPIFDLFREWTISHGKGQVKIPAITIPTDGTPRSLAAAGHSHFHARRYAQAIDSYSKALSTGPDFEIERCLAEAYIAAGDRRSARRALDRAHRLNPRHRRVVYRALVMRYPWLGVILKRTAHTVPKR